MPARTLLIAAIAGTVGGMVALLVWQLLGCVLWLVMTALNWHNLRHIACLESWTPPTPARWPKLSVIVPACNEAATLEAAFSSLLAQDYPNIEFLLVNDRSTDGTGDVADRWAQRDPRVRVLHVTALPDGWLGKTHAMHVATQVATGEWLLYTDADVAFAPGALRHALAWAIHQQLDHLSLGPHLHARTLLAQSAVTTFGGLVLAATRAADVGRPGSQAHIGIGAFNLVRAAAWQRTEGWPWLRLEISDDVGLALLLLRHGAKSGFAVSRSLVAMAWYGTVSEMVRGLEKNGFAVVARFSVWRVVAGVLVLVTAALAPTVALAGPLWWLGALAWTGLATVAWGAQRRFAMPGWPLLLAPVAMLTMVWMLVRSTWVTLRRGGVVWRGTLYPLARLRHAQHVKL